MSKSDHPTGRQIAAARAITGRSQADVAESARISLPTLRRMEAASGPIAGIPNNVAAVISTLEADGIEFIADERGIGVIRRWRSRLPDRGEPAGEPGGP